jgi:pimeloyl-ACP methyl ester carboxylesterase
LPERFTTYIKEEMKMKKNYSFAILMLLICLIKTAPTSAQHSNSLQGYWMGNLKISSGEEIRMAFRIQQNADKGYSASIDVPDQGAMGIPVNEVEVNGENLLIKARAIGAVYEGKLNPKEMLIQGNFVQGDTTSLSLVPIDLNSVEGVWMGPLEISGGEKIRALFEISADGEGAYTAEFGVPDQGAMGIPVEKIEFLQDGLIIDLKKYGISFYGTMHENGLSISGSFIQGDTVDLVLARYGSMPDLTTEELVVERPQTPEAPYPYLVEDVVFENYSADVKLAGTLTLPDTKNPSPAAILIHGSGRNDRNGTFAGTFHLLADYLTRQGIAVLRYDKRGVGESTGDYGEATTIDFASDVKAGIDFLKKDSRIDPESIGLIGHSEGGVIAPLVASETDDVAFMVIMAGLGQTFGDAAAYMRTDYARSIGKTESEAAVIHSWYSQFYELAGAVDDTVQRQIKIHEAYNNLPAADKDVIAWAEDDISREVKGTYWIWFHEALKLRPQKYFKESSCPTLAITGEKDRQANPKENLPIIEQSLGEGRCKDYTVAELPELNHLFQTAETGAVSEYEKIPEIIAPMALQTISDWMEERVNL